MNRDTKQLDLIEGNFSIKTEVYETNEKSESWEENLHREDLLNYGGFIGGGQVLYIKDELLGYISVKEEPLDITDNEARIKSKQIENEIAGMEVQPFDCQECSKVPTNEKVGNQNPLHYQKQLATNQGLIVRKSEINLSQSRSEEGKFTSYNSEYESKSEIQHQEHYNMCSKIEMFKCSKCNYESKRKDHLKVHELTHSEVKNLCCSNCSYKTNRKQRLKLHEMSHSKIKMFKCSTCNYETNQKCKLERHELTHSNFKKYKCSNCEYGSNQKANLRIHLLNHSEEKQFKCSECSYETNRKGNMKVHQMTHSQIKMLSCSKCNYKTNRKDALRSHEMNHTLVKMFKCFDCNYETNFKCNLKTHVLKHTQPTLAEIIERIRHSTQQRTLEAQTTTNNGK